MRSLSLSISKLLLLSNTCKSVIVHSCHFPIVFVIFCEIAPQNGDYAKLLYHLIDRTFLTFVPNFRAIG